MWGGRRPANVTSGKPEKRGGSGGGPMGQQRGSGYLSGGGILAGGTSPAAGTSPAGRITVLAWVAVGVAVIGALAGCSGSAAPSGSSAPTATAGAAATSSGTSSGTASASASGTASAVAAAAFVPIAEPFDPGHPAKTKPAPGSCGGQSSTLAIEQCFETQTENADVAIDRVQLARFQSGSQAQRAAVLADDSAWLAARQPVCAKAFHSGGSIDGVNTAGCLLDESTARLDALKGIIPPEPKLQSTDSTNPSALSWYTTPEGSRIGLIDTQGDATGGAVIAWVIIGGANGFLVNPAQFYYLDGTFTDHGKIQPPNPSGHRVAPGAEYQFAIDYSRLSHDPGASTGGGAWVYAPGTPVALWR